jgi:cobalt-zinc-cadmium efflux system protein
VLGLAIAWLASILVQRAPTARFTYGLRKASILAALFNAIFLILTVGAISWEAFLRLGAPEPVAGGVVVAVATIGIVINALTAWLFASGAKHDMNLRGAYLHMAADALVSFGVVLSALVMIWSGWLWLDPVVSLVIGAIIVFGTWGLLRQSVTMAMAAVPEGIDPDRVRAFLLQAPGVTGLHDLHIWPISTSETALTCHLVIPSGHPGDDFLQQRCAELARHFRISHTTIQIETDARHCGLAPDAVV